MKVLRAEIGIAILIGVATLWGILLLYSRGWGFWLAWTPLVGMALYISDRKGFLIRRSGDESKAALLAILGLALICESLFEGLFTLGLFIHWGGSLTLCAFALAFDGLVFLFGWLLFF